MSYAGSKYLIDEEGFHNALYMIDIGQNDLLLALYASNFTYTQVIEKIPSFLAEIKLAIQVSLYFHIIVLHCLEYQIIKLTPTCRIYIYMVAENFGYTTLDHWDVHLKNWHYILITILILIELDAFKSIMMLQKLLMKDFTMSVKK